MFEVHDNVYFIDADKVNIGMIEDIVDGGYVVIFITADGNTRLTTNQVFKSFDEAFASLLSSNHITDGVIKRFVEDWNATIAQNGKLTTATLCEQLQIGTHVTLLDEDVNPSIGVYMVKKHGRKYLITVPAAMINCTDALHDVRKYYMGVLYLLLRQMKLYCCQRYSRQGRGLQLITCEKCNKALSKTGEWEVIGFKVVAIYVSGASKRKRRHDLLSVNYCPMCGQRPDSFIEPKRIKGK